MTLKKNLWKGCVLYSRDVLLRHYNYRKSEVGAAAVLHATSNSIIANRPNFQSMTEYIAIRTLVSRLSKDWSVSTFVWTHLKARLDLQLSLLVLLDLYGVMGNAPPVAVFSAAVGGAAGGSAYTNIFQKMDL